MSEKVDNNVLSFERVLSKENGKIEQINNSPFTAVEDEFGTYRLCMGNSIVSRKIFVSVEEIYDHITKVDYDILLSMMFIVKDFKFNVNDKEVVK